MLESFIINSSNAPLIQEIQGTISTPGQSVIAFC
jgi:hypothetical protein